MTSLPVDRVYVLHVKTGYEERGESIERQFAQLGIPFQFMLDGDIPDITPAIVQTWFAGGMCQPDALRAVSCAWKHLLIYGEIVRDGLQNALVFEDDILLAPDFVPQCARTIAELHQRSDLAPSRAWISYENSTLRVPPRHERRADRMLYPAREPRCTGAYYIGQAAARGLWEIARTEKMAQPYDCFVAEVLARTNPPLDMLWCHPTLAEQGSMNGQFGSAMDLGRPRSWLRRLKWFADKHYKRLKQMVA
jgi:glycosyl transferase family 25